MTKPMLGLPGGYRMVLSSPDSHVLLETDLRPFARMINHHFSKFSGELTRVLQWLIRRDQDRIADPSKLDRSITVMHGLPGGYRLTVVAPEGRRIFASDLRRFARMINLDYCEFTADLLTALQKDIREDTDRQANAGVREGALLPINNAHWTEPDWPKPGTPKISRISDGQPVCLGSSGLKHSPQTGRNDHKWRNEMSQNEISQITDPKSVYDGSEPKYVFRKADLKPGDKKYNEVTAVQVDAAYLAQHGDRVVTKEQPQGQPIEIGQWVLTRVEADGSTQQWTNYDETSPIAQSGQGAKFQERWKPVDGKPGSFSPRSVPTPMVELPEGGKLKVSWGEAAGGPGSFLAKYGEGDYNIITKTDLVNLGYTGTDEVSEAKLAEIAANL